MPGCGGEFLRRRFYFGYQYPVRGPSPASGTEAHINFVGYFFAQETLRKTDFALPVSK